MHGPEVRQTGNIVELEILAGATPDANRDALTAAIALAATRVLTHSRGVVELPPGRFIASLADDFDPYHPTPDTHRYGWDVPDNVEIRGPRDGSQCVIQIADDQVTGTTTYIPFISNDSQNVSFTGNVLLDCNARGQSGSSLEYLQGNGGGIVGYGDGIDGFLIDGWTVEDCFGDSFGIGQSPGEEEGELLATNQRIEVRNYKGNGHGEGFVAAGGRNVIVRDISLTHRLTGDSTGDGLEFVQCLNVLVDNVKVVGPRNLYNNQGSCFDFQSSRDVRVSNFDCWNMFSIFDAQSQGGVYPRSIKFDNGRFRNCGVMPSIDCEVTFEKVTFDSCGLNNLFCEARSSNPNAVLRFVNCTFLNIGRFVIGGKHRVIFQNCFVLSNGVAPIRIDAQYAETAGDVPTIWFVGDNHFSQLPYGTVAAGEVATPAGTVEIIGDGVTFAPIIAFFGRTNLTGSEYGSFQVINGGSLSQVTTTGEVQTDAGMIFYRTDANDPPSADLVQAFIYSRVRETGLLPTDGPRRDNRGLSQWLAQTGVHATAHHTNGNDPIAFTSRGVSNPSAAQAWMSLPTPIVYDTTDEWTLYLKFNRTTNENICFLSNSANSTTAVGITGNVIYCNNDAGGGGAVALTQTGDVTVRIRWKDDRHLWFSINGGAESDGGDATGSVFTWDQMFRRNDGVFSGTAGLKALWLYGADKVDGGTNAAVMTALNAVP